MKHIGQLQVLVGMHLQQDVDLQWQRTNWKLAVKLLYWVGKM